MSVSLHAFLNAGFCPWAASSCVHSRTRPRWDFHRMALAAGPLVDAIVAAKAMIEYDTIVLLMRPRPAEALRTMATMEAATSADLVACDVSYL